MGSGKAEPLAERVFQEEPIRPRQSASADRLPAYVREVVGKYLPRRGNAPAEKLPSLLRAARSLEQGSAAMYQNRRSLFLKQARLLAGYEDDYPELLQVTRYFPTYDSHTDRELRRYFSWPTRVRRGDAPEACTTFAFLYLYELINQVGADSPVEGLQKMDAFVDRYGGVDSTVPRYYRSWRKSYILYYNLSDSFWQEDGEPDGSAYFDILDSAPEQPAEAVMQAVTALAPGWLGRSKFYKTHRQDMERVVAAVVGQMCLHYRRRGGRSLSEQLFGGLCERPFELFPAAVFCDPLKKREAAYYLTDTHYFMCSGGYWVEAGRFIGQRGQKKLDGLMKSIDASLRDALEPGKPLLRPEQSKWVEKAIAGEIQALLDEKEKARQAAQRVAIDFGALDAIRRDAAVTQERLRIEDELEEEAPPAPAPEPVPAGAGIPAREPGEDCPLNAAEYRLLQCLLYGRPTDWVQREGKILSVLLDSINEKLYDIFQDSVAEDDGLVEDYIDELKEMVAP